MALTRTHAPLCYARIVIQYTCLLLWILARPGLASSLPPAASNDLIPNDFFNNHTLSADDRVFVTADKLTINEADSIVTLSGNVWLSTQSFLIASETAIYNQETGEVTLIGSVKVRDPVGEEYVATHVRLLEGFRKGFIESLALDTPEGLRIKAANAELLENRSMNLDEASATPCGDCRDKKGRQIGWRLKSEKVLRDSTKKMLYFTNATLEVAGTPIAYFPRLFFPDPELSGLDEVFWPRLSYSLEKGSAIRYPGFVWASPEHGLTVSPELYTRQGVLGEVNWHKAFGDSTYSANGWGIYQLDPAAFAGRPGETGFRGAVQGKAAYRLADNWRAGGQFTTFTDRAFLTDYGKGDQLSIAGHGRYASQALTARQLTNDRYIEARAAYFTGIGNVGEMHERSQGHILPQISGHAVMDAPAGSGQIILDGNLLRIARNADNVSLLPGATYVQGYQGEKTHLMAQAAWRDQWVLPAGVLVEPYLAARTDIAQYDGTSSHFTAPGADVTHSVTPIAALDMSLPLEARGEGVRHYLVPRVKVVSRGGPVSTGITNDTAQGFVFDESTLFSVNRFAGFDRQDSGTRAALGLLYKADFDDGRWFEFGIGQSYHLTGENAASVQDGAHTGAGSGAEGATSHFVVSAKGRPFSNIELGSSVLIDPADSDVPRATAAIRYQGDVLGTALTYAWQSKETSPGAISDRHEVAGVAQLALDDYWRLILDTRYDLTTRIFDEYGARVGYDDGYTSASVYYRSAGAPGANQDRIGVEIKLKMLADLVYSHDY